MVELSKTNSSRVSAIIKQLFYAKAQKNVRYSMRAFARDMGISPSYLAMLISGSRRLTEKKALQISTSLELPEETRQELLRLTVLDREETMAFGRHDSSELNMSPDLFSAISDWHHVAILDLMAIDDFKADPDWIADKLSIPRAQAEQSLTLLLKLGLARQENQVFRKQSPRLNLHPSESIKAVRHFHQQMLKKASDELNKTESVHFQRRDITGTVIAIDENKLAEASQRIEKFRRHLSNFLTAGKRNSLFHLSVQLFPLTTPNKD